MKKILLLAMILSLILSGCGIAEKRYVEDRSDKLEALPLTDEIYSITVIKATYQMIKTAQTLKANTIQIGLGHRDYKEEISLVEKHLEEIQEARDKIVDIKPSVNKEDERDSLVESIDEYSIAVNAYLSLLEKDKISKEELQLGIDNLTTSIGLVKMNIN